MKTATLPSIRIEPEFRDELEAALNEGESLTEFIEASVRGGLQRRTEQAAFVARARASLEEARRTGGTTAADVVVSDLRSRLAGRVTEELRRRASPSGE